MGVARRVRAVEDMVVRWKWNGEGGGEEEMVLRRETRGESQRGGGDGCLAQWLGWIDVEWTNQSCIAQKRMKLQSDE